MMDGLPLRLKTFLLDAADRLRAIRLPHELSEALERLAVQVDQPCVVAVVGRMKAGKSTFINALLLGAFKGVCQPRRGFRKFIGLT
jgi:ABC-type branched-subunit amino acid transport system ATPase component